MIVVDAIPTRVAVAFDRIFVVALRELELRMRAENLTLRSGLERTRDMPVEANDAASFLMTLRAVELVVGREAEVKRKTPCIRQRFARSYLSLGFLLLAWILRNSRRSRAASSLRPSFV